MPVTILETVDYAPDGTDYCVILSDGVTRHIYHAATPPADPQAFCDAAEAAMLAAMESQFEIEAEGGEIIL